MALIIESGSLVVGANSYVTVEEARAFATARASAFPGDDASVESALIVANDYLESLGDQYKGSKVSPGVQSLQWPRKCVVIEGWEVPIDTIPPQLKNAQCQLAMDSAAGVDLMPTITDTRQIIHKKVDVLETEWAPGEFSSSPQLARANAFLAPLLDIYSGGLKVIRV